MISAVVFQTIIYFLLVVVLVILVYLGIESIRTVRGMRRLISRVDCMTDIKEWLFFFRKFSRCVKK
jgi:hypothetical protein